METVHSTSSVLIECESKIPDSIEPQKPRSFFSFFRRSHEVKERQDKMGQIVHDMSLYLTRNPGLDATVKRISTLGKILAGESLSQADKALLERVRLAALLRERPEDLEKIRGNISTIYFKTAMNREYLKKWKEAGFPEEAFLYNPTVSAFIFKTHIHHKMRQYAGFFTTENNLPWKYNNETHEFLILQDGVFKNLAHIVDDFEIRETKRLGSVIPSLVRKGTEEKWDFLPEKGLTQWDESDWTELRPFARLSPAQVRFAQEHARGTDGAPGREDEYVVEIVSTKDRYVPRPFISGYQETFKSFRHPWIRIITPTGDFYSVGFNIGQDLKPGQPAAPVRGIFRNPDSWETMQFSQRFITGFAVSKETCDDIIALCVSEQTKEVTSFSIFEKNCTAFIDGVAKKLNPAEAQTRSFGAPLSELFLRCVPKSLQAVGRKLRPVGSCLYTVGKNLCPPLVRKIALAVSHFFQFIAGKVAVGFSGKWFSRRRLETFPDPLEEAKKKENDENKEIPWYKVVTRLDNLVKRNLVRVFLPRKVGEWQQDLVNPTKPGPGKTRIVEHSTPLFEQYGVVGQQ